MRHIGSSKAITPQDMKTNEALPPTVHYDVRDSILQVAYTEPPITVMMRVFVVEKILEGPGLEQKGDLILAAYRNNPADPDTQWLLRKPS